MQLLQKIKTYGWYRRIDWNLLAFLLLFLNVKMPVKIATMILFLVLNRKLFKEKNHLPKFTWFYFSLIAIALINLLFDISSVSLQYLFMVAVGIMFWLLCAGSSLLTSWFVARTETEKLHSTITLFFILNALVSLSQLFLMILDAGTINPYLYQGMYQKYFINTGDMVTGITFDVSTTNAMLNAFGLVYFLRRNKMALGLLCMLVLLLAASNFTNVLLLVVLAFLFIFQSTRDQKSIILVCFSLLVIFMIRVSPQNDNYVIEIYNKVFNKKITPRTAQKTTVPVTEKPDSLLSDEEKKQRIARQYLDSLATASIEIKRKEDPLQKPEQQPAFPELVSKPVIPKPDIHSEPFQRKTDTSASRKELLEFAIKTIPDFDISLSRIKSRKLPGKIFAFRQTYEYLKNHPRKLITGSGIGKFSSKLAFRATGLQMAGGYPQKLTYINDDFRDNHLDLYLEYFSKETGLHSLVNSPHAVYDQLIAEYGLLGILAFLFLYLAFFIKRLKKIPYGLPLLLLLLGAFGVEYWYEQLSIVIIFELLMLIGIKEATETK